jgi:sugar O-acyltransferase (sialic acid O-acetyltransferase NeuD family)
VTNTRRVILVGAGRFAEEVTDLARDCGMAIAAWIEGLDETRASREHEPPIVWAANQRLCEPSLAILPAIGSPKRRTLVESLIDDGRALAPPLIHPSSTVASTATIEPGCVVFPNVVIGARTTIGAGTIINRGALIGHHSRIGMHAFLGPGANVAGGVTVGDEAYLGIGCIIRDDRSIGARSTVGAGAVVVADVPDSVTVIGLPARPMERA